MQSMPATVDAADVALRLGLTVLAGLLIGYNRRELAFVVSGPRQGTDVRAPEFLADFARHRACSGSNGRPWRSARELPRRRAPL